VFLSRKRDLPPPKAPRQRAAQAIPLELPCPRLPTAPGKAVNGLEGRRPVQLLTPDSETLFTPQLVIPCSTIKTCFGKQLSEPHALREVLMERPCIGSGHGQDIQTQGVGETEPEDRPAES
jgi:hypothetical protein